MTITKHLESISFSSLSLPDLLELPKSSKWKRQLQSQQYPLTRSTSFISSIDIFHTPHIHPIVLLAIKVFTFSIIYHLVEEKTSKSIPGFNYSWYITFFELSCAFLLECIERISIVFNQLNTNTSNLSMVDEESQSLLHIDTNNNHNNHNHNQTMGICHRFYISIISILSLSNLCRWSYLFLSFNLVFSRGLATIVLQYYDMDYPTYAICRNSKMVFVMFLSVVWLKKSYHCADWILVLLTSLSVLCFRLASHDVWFSSANMMGVPLLLLSTFLSAMDNSWKEKVTIGIKGISPNEILFNINLIAISILFIYLTLFSSEYMAATSFLMYNPTAILWMLLRGISYSLWIHFSVTLIAKAGALLNQYVSASRKLFSVILSFIMFSKPFYFMHGIGFLFFMFACVVKILMAQKKKTVIDIDVDKALSEKVSDTDCDVEDIDVDVDGDMERQKSEDGQINTVQNRKEHKLLIDSDREIDGESDFEERKYNGYKLKNNNCIQIQNTSRINMFVQ